MDRQRELDEVLERMIADYVAHNSAAQILKTMLEDTGVGFVPVIDHVTLRTLDIDRRAEQFVAFDYAYDETLHYDDWYAKVYRKAGYPALFVDQGYPDDRGKTSIIPGWVKKAVPTHRSGCANSTPGSRPASSQELSKDCRRRIAWRR